VIQPNGDGEAVGIGLEVIATGVGVTTACVGAKFCPLLAEQPTSNNIAPTTTTLRNRVIAITFFAG